MKKYTVKTDAISYAISQTGCRFVSVTFEEYIKRGLFAK